MPRAQTFSQSSTSTGCPWNFPKQPLRRPRPVPSTSGLGMLRAAQISAFWTSSPLTGPKPGTWTMPSMSSRQIPVTAWGCILPMSPIMCARVQPWTRKLKTGAPASTWWTGSFPCCRSSCPMASAASTPNRTGSPQAWSWISTGPVRLPIIS